MDVQLEKEVKTLISDAMKAHLQGHHSARTRWKPPTLQEVQEYIRANPELANVDAKVFWKSFEDGGWIDTQGKPVRNWKMKLRTWSNMRGPVVPKKRPPCNNCRNPADFRASDGSPFCKVCQPRLYELYGDNL